VNKDTSNVKTLAEIVQFFTTRLEGLSDSTQPQDSSSKQLAEKNVIPGPGSTLGIGERSVNPRLSSNERSRVYEIGTILAKAQYNFNLTKKVDKKEKALIRQSEFGMPGKQSFSGTRVKGKKDSDSEDGGGLLDSIMGIKDTFDSLKDTFDSAKDGVKKAKRGVRRLRRAPRSLPRLARRKLSKIRLPKIFSRAPKVSVPKVPKVSVPKVAVPKVPKVSVPTVPKVPTVIPKVATKAGSIGSKVLDVGSKVSTATKGVGGAGKATAALGTIGTAVGSIAPALGKVGSAVGTVGKVAGKVVAPLALAIDGVTAVTKLSTEAGRENLRATAESLDYQKDFFGTLGKAVLSPLETSSAIGLATYDLIESSRAAAKSEANLKVAEEKSQEKTAKYDTDKTGKIDTLEEKLKLWNSADSGPSKMKFYNDKTGKKWRYDKQADTFTSLEGNMQMSSKDFVRRETQKEGAKTDNKEQAPQPSTPTITDPQLTTPPPAFVPEQPKALGIARAAGDIVTKEAGLKAKEAEKIATSGAKEQSQNASIDLTSQNNLIVQQTQILSELLKTSKMQLGIVEKAKPTVINNTSGGSTNVSSSNKFDTGTETSRSMYGSSPYTLSPV
jgi:hypothetical protein